MTYFEASRAPRYSLLFALPLLLLYEGLAAVLSGNPAGDIRNGADVILTGLFISVAGAYGPLVFVTLMAGVCIWLIARDMRKHGRSIRPMIFGGMLAESLLLAFLCGAIVSTATSQLLGAFSPLGAVETTDSVLSLVQPQTLSWPRRLMISLGAGLYEELLFRVLLVSGLTLIAKRALGWKPLAAGIGATLLSALIFSIFHYIGPLGDPWELRSFVFRLIAGLFFSGLYILRGFGIAAWTHALYDVIVLVF